MFLKESKYTEKEKKMIRYIADDLEISSHDSDDEWINSFMFKHSPKKRKDSLETQAVLLILLLELEITGDAVQSIHQNSDNWWLL